MKNTSLKINVLVVYKDWIAIEAVWIEDWYTDCQIPNYIMEELIEKYWIFDMRWWSEARNFCWKYWEYEIKIEEKEILF